MYDPSGVNNADVIEKINALLGNTLDLTNLTGMTGDQSKGICFCCI